MTMSGICLQVITPFDVYLNSKLVIQDYEVWRLITNFFYFGKLGSYLHPLLQFYSCSMFLFVVLNAHGASTFKYILTRLCPL